MTRQFFCAIKIILIYPLYFHLVWKSRIGKCNQIDLQPGEANGQTAQEIHRKFHGRCASSPAWSWHDRVQQERTISLSRQRYILTKPKKNFQDISNTNVLSVLIDYNSINKFLNRLLGVPVELQNSIFQFFSDILAAVILEAKRTGKWDMGILDLGSNNEVVFRKDTKFYVLDSKVESQRRVEMHTVLVERGLSWEKALEMYKKTQLVTTNSMDENIENEGGKQRPQGFYISNQVKNNHRVAILAVAFVPVLPPGLISKEDPKGGDCSFLAIYRPNTGLQVRQETPESLLKKYKRVSWYC